MNDSLSQIYQIAGDSCYGALALVALWGAYCVIIVWRRIAQIRFRNEPEQSAFLATLESSLSQGDFDGAALACADDARAVPQLALAAINNRDLGYSRVKHLVADLFQREVLADIEHRISWIITVIKTAPMLGLFGTVLGMMAAFGKLGAASADTKLEPNALANDIMLALITTALGLSIAIPLTLCVASINIRIRKLEDLVGLGLTRFFESFKAALPGNKHG
jgi:biopolymer transport protein ExbB/TolQ